MLRFIKVEVKFARAMVSRLRRSEIGADSADYLILGTENPKYVRRKFLPQNLQQEQHMFNLSLWNLFPVTHSVCFTVR